MKQRYQLVAFVLIAFIAATAPAQTVITWANLGSDFGTAANWGGILPVSDTTSNVISFNSSVPMNQPVLAGPYSVAGVQFFSISGPFTLSGAGPLTIGASGIDNQTAAATQVISVPLIFATSGTTISNQGTLQLTGAITDNVSGGLTLSGVGNGGSISGQISGSGGLIKSGSGVWTLAGANTYTGATSINSGLVVANNLTGSATGSGTVTIASGATLQLGIGSSSGSVGGAVVDNGTLSFHRSDNVTFSNGISGTGGLTQAGDGTITLGGTNTYSGLTMIGTQTSSGHLADAAAGSFSPNSQVSMYGGGLDVNFNETIKGLGDLTISSTKSPGAVTLASGATLTLSGGSDFSGTIGGSGTFVVGSGVLEAVSGDIALPVGGTTIQAGGKLTIGAGAAAGTISGPINNSGTLEFNRSDAISYGGFAGTGSIAQSGTGTLTLTGSNTYSGTTQLNAGSLADAAPNSFSPNSSVSLLASGANLNVNFNETIAGLGGSSSSVGTTTNLAPGATLTINNAGRTYQGTIAGGGGLVISGLGTETLGGANTYTGGTTINGGVLIATNTSGSATGSGTITVGTSGALQLGAGGAGGAVSGNIVDNGKVYYASADASTYAGVISGTGRLDVGSISSSTGTLTLTGANTYSGGTSINAGLLQIGADNTLPTTTSVSIGASGSLDVVNNQTIARLNGTYGGSVSLGAGKTLTLAATSGSSSATFDGSFSGPGALQIAGVAGSSVMFDGSSSFSGGTNVAGGTLYLGSANALGTGAVAVQANAALLVNPSASGDVTLANPISLADGAIVGSSLRDASLTLSGTVTVPTGTPTVQIADFLMLSGPVTAASGSTSLTFASASGGFGNVVLLAAPNANVTNLTASGAGVIFGASAAVPASGLTLQASTGYVGVAAVPDYTVPTAAAVLNLIANRGAFNGTVGFDTGSDTVAPHNFADALDLTGFGGSFSVGSVTRAVLSGTITPPSTGYAFGNGGGVLFVQSPLTGNYDLNVNSTTGIPNNTLTVALQGNNTFTGNVTVTNSALVLDSANALPLGRKVTLGANGYVSYTQAFTGVGSFADFVANRLGSYTSSSVIGLDSTSYIAAAIAGPTGAGQRLVTETVDLSSLGSIYLGTSTDVQLAGTVIAPNQSGANKTLSLLARGDGRLTISSTLVASNVSKVVVGSATAPDADGAVALIAPNTFAGGTELQSGTLVIDENTKQVNGAIVTGPLGTGALVVPGNAQKPRLVAGDTYPWIDNDISLGTKLILGVSPALAEDSSRWESAFATNSLNLNGVISDLDGTHPGSLDVFGYTNLYGQNTFSGGTNLEPGSDTTFNNAAAFGTGVVTVNSYGEWVYLANYADAVTLPNAFVFNSDGTNGVWVYSSAPLTLGGAVTLNNTATISDSSDLRITGQISGTGRLNWTGTSTLTLSPSVPNTFTGGITASLGSVVLSNANAMPATPYSGVLRATGIGYIGIGYVPANLQGDFIDRFDRSTTNGSIGFDSASATSPNTFNSPINLSGFATSPSLGSASSAILGSAAVITPKGTTYAFGGGGGELEVQSPLIDVTGAVSSPRNVTVITAGVRPLTVRLTGANTYTGSTTVSNAALIFGANALPATSMILANGNGYVGTEDPTFAANPTAFVNHLNAFTQNAIIGFDSPNPASPYVVSGAISLANFNSAFDPGIFLGTTTSATISGAITLPSAQGEYAFAGYKGGALTVASTLTDGAGSRSVTIGTSGSAATAGINGLTQDMALSSGFSSVTLTGPNTYSGGTALNAGALYVGADGALGTGPIMVGGNSTIPYRGLFASGAARTLPNAITLNGWLAVGGDFDLTLSGNVTGSENLGKVGTGTLTLSGDNSGYSGFTHVLNGSVVFQTGSSVGLGQLLVAGGASATFADSSTVNGLFNGDDGSGGTINLTATKTLLINQTDGSEFSGTFAGATAGLSFDSTAQGAPSWMRLAGASTYSGPTTILSGGAVVAENANSFGSAGNTVTMSGGRLAVGSGVTLANPIALSAGQLSGIGTFQAATVGFDIKAGVVLSPGFGTGGTLTFDGSQLTAVPTVVLDGGGQYDWHLIDTANATSGWDTVLVNGTVNIAASGTSKFKINIVSASLDGSQGLVTNFDPNHPYSWSILQANQITGYTGSSQFDLLTSSFLNPNGGQFSLSLDGTGTNLMLTFNPVPEPSTYALILAGLGLTWFASRRRRRA